MSAKNPRWPPGNLVFFYFNISAHHRDRLVTSIVFSFGIIIDCRSIHLNTVSEIAEFDDKPPEIMKHTLKLAQKYVQEKTRIQSFNHKVKLSVVKMYWQATQ